MWTRLVEIIRKQIDVYLQAKVSASSAVQCAVIALFNKAPEELAGTVTDSESLMSWLVGVATKKLRDRIRRESAMKRVGEPGVLAVEFDAVDPIELQSCLPDPALVAELGDFHDRCMKAVEDDPDLRKVTVAVMFLGGHSNREIAKKLCMSEAWVRKALATIIATWREIENQPV